MYGVVSQSPLFDLVHFSPIAFSPPDVMHDVLEGVSVEGAEFQVLCQVLALTLHA